MARRLCIALTVVMLLAHSTLAAPEATMPLCSRDFHAAIQSPACHGHGLDFLSAQRTVLDVGTVGDRCIDSLRVLIAMTATSMPCEATLNDPVSPTRQLAATRTFHGKLQCKFDLAAPLNVSDLSQAFVIECDEVPKETSSYLWLYILLGIGGGGFVLFALWLFVPSCVQNSKETLTERREHHR